MSISKKRVAALFCLLGFSTIITAKTAAQKSKTAAPQLSTHVIWLLPPIQQAQLEVANTLAEKQLGLMSRTTLPENAGMLFNFSKRDTGTVCFWMKNTLIPLTVGFIDEDGVLLQTEDMSPQTETTHCAKKTIRYAIEMNQGWFLKNRVAVGTPILKVR